MEGVDPIQVPQYQRSNASAQVPPFPLLIGEHPLLISKTVDGNAMVTNFRFCICERRSFINIPLMMVGELLAMEATRRLRIGCKDGSTYSCTFATTDDCSVCSTVLKEKTGQPQGMKALFAYRFYSVASLKQSQPTIITPPDIEQIAWCKPVNAQFAYSFGKEVERLGFDTNRRRLWRMSHANESFEFCATYPKLHILPATVDDDKLKSSLDFRALKRFPSVVWRDKNSGAVLIRSSQPLSSFLGVSYFQNHSDLTLIEEIVNACNKDREYIAQQQQQRSGLALLESELASLTGEDNGGGNSNGAFQKEDGAQGSLVSENNGGASNGHGASNGSYEYDDIRAPRKLAIVDCRSLAGVWGNSFKGGGTEDEAQYKCNTIHLDMANIHSVRDSFNKLRALCHTYVEGTYYKTLSGCMWLAYLSAVLRGANIVVELMHIKKRPVLVHCSDGWDRTSQIVSLSELMMDSYYRTIQGFQVLVEREWLHFGHKFGERGGHDPNCTDTNQISPIFLQFLDCVYQLTLQYPAEFQFNEAYLVKLLKHSQACLFGTFLHNCQKERENCPKTASLWALLKPDNNQFVNQLYKPTLQILTAKYSEHDIVLWKSVYMAGLSPWPHSSQADFSLSGGGGEEAGNTAAEGMPRSKSMDDLSKINVDSGRRNSDPNTAKNQEVAAAAPGSGDIHDTSSSAELLHYPDESPPCGTKLTPANKSEENIRDSPRKLSPNPSSNSIKLSPTSEEKSSSPQNGATGHSQDDEAQDASPSTGVSTQIPEISPEQNMNLGEEDAQISGQVHSISDSDSTLVVSEDSKAQNNVPSSSAVTGQNEAVVNDSEQTLCCDKEMTSSAPQVLSSETKLSTSNGNDSMSGYEVRQTNSCPQSYSIPVDSATTVTASPPKSTSAGSRGMSYDNTRQTSLLAERLALSGDADMAMYGKGHESNGSNLNDSKRHLSGDSVNQHSRKSTDINDIRDALKAQAQIEMARKIPVDSTQITHHSNGKSGAPATSAGEGETIHVMTGTSPFQTLDVINDANRTNINTISTETLTEEPETGGDTMPPTAAAYSKPLEVSTKQERVAATPPPITPSSSTSSLLSSPLKRDNYSSDVNEATTGSKLMSRRARAASGASRDLSVSPCACRGNWSDTGRLRHPSGGGEIVSRRLLGATVATSTTDISDSYVGQLRLPSIGQQASIKQHIDIDGLTLFCDERQDLLAELVSEKDRKIMDLENRLSKAIEIIRNSAKGRQAQQQPPPAAIMDELLASDSEGGEMSSLGAMSNPASDASWEQIDESEAKMVLWVPDSAVTHCAGCDGAFWQFKRKHHCRNCGKVFCAECSSYMAPVPHQHLNKPERVCRRCHSHLLQLSPGASSDGRIPTLVADG